MPIKNALLGVPKITQLKQTFDVSEFTDGGSTSGTVQFTNYVPAGAVLVATKVGPVTGFTGDTTATVIIGDGSDTDRYNTGTPSLFTTAAVGVEVGVPSGSKLITTANRPTLTVTSSTDFTLVKTAGAGRVTVSIYYIKTL